MSIDQLNKNNFKSQISNGLNVYPMYTPDFVHEVTVAKISTSQSTLTVVGYIDVAVVYISHESFDRTWRNKLVRLFEQSLVHRENIACGLYSLLFSSPSFVAYMCLTNVSFHVSCNIFLCFFVSFEKNIWMQRKHYIIIVSDTI